METANIPQQNYPPVEVEPFTFFFPLIEKIIISQEVRVIEIGNLKVQGFAYRSLNALGEVVITADVQWVKHVGVDVKPLLVHFGNMEAVQEAALRHAERVTFAPKPTKENVLQAIIDTVHGLKEHEPLSFLSPLTIRLSDNDHHIVTVEGLVVTHKRELVVLQGNGEGDKLEASDGNADKMIPAIYKELEKRFPHHVKTIA